ncbi:MAG TPA: hypothetical protein VK167_15140 [Flavipsychrobacter sp.]|nr:hypothetical protein [Flavipsychrobacter sp.]
MKKKLLAAAILLSPIAGNAQKISIGANLVNNINTTGNHQWEMMNSAWQTQTLTPQYSKGAKSLIGFNVKVKLTIINKVEVGVGFERNAFKAKGVVQSSENADKYATYIDGSTAYATAKYNMPFLFANVRFKVVPKTSVYAGLNLGYLFFTKNPVAYTEFQASGTPYSAKPLNVVNYYPDNSFLTGGLQAGVSVNVYKHINLLAEANVRYMSFKGYSGTSYNGPIPQMMYIAPFPNAQYKQRMFLLGVSLGASIDL